MRRAFSIRDLTEGALMTALTMVVIISSAYIPGFTIIGMFAACVPIACLTMRRNFITAGIAVVVCAFLSIFITHSLVGTVELTLIMILPGFVTGICFYKRINFFTALSLVCGCVVAGMIFAIFMLNLLTNGEGLQGLLDESMLVFEQTIRTVISNAYSGMQKVSQEELMAVITEIEKQIKDTILLYFPSFVIIISLVIGYLQTMLSAFVIKRTRSGVPPIVPFQCMKAPKSMCYLTAILFLLSLFMSQDNVLDAALLNVNLILYFLIGICGFSFVDAKIAQKIPGGVFRIMVYVGAIMLGGALIGFLFNGLILLGILDSMMDFRRLGKAGKDYAGKE